MCPYHHCKNGTLIRLSRISLFIAGMLWIGVLNLFNLFLYKYFIYLIDFFLRIIRREIGNFYSPKFVSDIPVRQYTKEFYDYCNPMFVYSLISLVVGILDRWILQFYGGSIQQGFFGLAFNIGAFCFLFTSALSPLIMREFSIAFEKKDIAKIARDFRRYIPFFMH
jgi:O-antigen/teichoic acid export membrane protein